MVFRSMVVKLKLSKLLASFALVFLSVVSPLRALSAADQKEIQSFALSDEFVTRYLAAVVDGRQHKGEDSESDSRMMESLDGLEAEMRRSPEVVAAMSRRSITTRQSVVAAIVLLRARLADKISADPKMATYMDKNKLPNAENMAVYHRHKAAIDKAMDRDDD